MQITHQTPLVAGRTKLGKIKFWQGFTGIKDGQVVRFTKYWQRNENGVDSKEQTSVPTKVLPKNVGRSNETKPEDQAISEITSEYNLKIDKGYRDYVEGGPVHDIREGGGKIAPQLAHDLTKYNDAKKSKIKFPIGADPKLDGFRALHHVDMGFWSRNGKEVIPEVVQHIVLPDLGEGVYWDGELMLPLELLPESGYDNVFQATSVRLKKYRSPEINEAIKFYVFDIYDESQPDLTREQRYARLQEIFAEHSHPSIELVPMWIANSWGEVDDLKNVAIELGYEGLVVKVLDAVYEVGARSHGTLKVKDFADEEFECIDIIPGQGKEENIATAVCRTTGGKEFKSSFIGTTATREKILTDKADWIGQMITIRHQPPYYQDGTPRFPKSRPVLRSDIE